MSSFKFLALISLVLLSCPANGQDLPIHRYSFSEVSGTEVADLVGSADGLVRGSGASWGNGALSLPGGSSASAAYVDLPNGLISGLTDLTFEMWVTNDAVRTWARIFDFGSSNFSEVNAPGGGGTGTDYFFLAASRGGNGNQQRVEIRNEDPAGGGIVTMDGDLPTSLGTQYHHVVTYDADGAGALAQIKYYRDGVLVAQGDTPIQLSDLNDVNNWLGRSNWTADDNFEGSFHEFRIYEAALDQAAVAASRDAGPDNLPSGAPAIDSFAASSAEIFEGESATLSWSITGVTGQLEVSISPDPGSIAGNPASGNVVVSPMRTTTYVLTAQDAEGSQSAEVTVTVNFTPAAPTDLSLSSLQFPSTAVNGSLLSAIATDDPNGQDLHAYSLVNGFGDTDNGRFRISANSLLANQSFAGEIGSSFAIRLRVTDNTGLSFEKAIMLTVVEATGSIVINEVHYDPINSKERLEFIELHNSGSTVANLSSWSFDKGVDFTFPAGVTLEPGGYLVVAEHPASLRAKYGVSSLGPWSGRLNGEGEDVVLLDSAGQVIDEVDYRLGFPWPVGSGGDGGSMELLNPNLDNELGSSWRVSLPPGDLPEANLLPFGSMGWSWRPGLTEASNPTSAWRQGSFVEDDSWTAGAQTPIGYGSVTGLPLNTTVGGMLNTYSSLFARKTFVIAPGEIPTSLQIRSTSDDGILIWINGVEVERRRFSGEPTVSDLASGQGSEGSIETVTLSDLGGILVEGQNTIAVQLFNSDLGSSDVGFDLEVIRPALSGVPPQPTPGELNSVFTTNAPPNIRQVNHSPQTPTDAEDVIITAKVTDPQGVQSVTLNYQLVAPGQFIPSRTPRTVSQIMADPEGDPPLNPAFEDPANWTGVAMADDGSNGDVLSGDGVFTATIPAQTHRTLVRYRIEVEDALGATVRVPFEDDPSLNFAYFVYNGVPDYEASTRSVHPDGAGHVWPKETIESLPVYHWLIRPQDMHSLQAYSGNQQFTNNGSATELAARRAWEWEGAMVYDGVVYDHIRSRLRGGNSRYGDFDGRFPRGKRHYKFRFNRGHHFDAKDEKGRSYDRKWRVFNVSRMFGTKGGNSWGLSEEIGDRLYHTMGAPTQQAHWFHFRVIDGADEAPDQYNGDFWGIQQVQERYDVRFLEARDMPKGNLYKLSDFFFDADSQRRYQSREMVDDGSEFDNIRFNLHGGQDANWLNEHVNYESWYGYSAVGEAIRHYDIFPEPNGRHRLKNLVWYFEPTGTDPSRGICWLLPYDYDASWGPSFNNGWDHARNGLYGHVPISGQPYINKPDMKIAHRNVLRSFRDLVWQPDQVGSLLDDRAAFISEMSMADQDRWRSAPVSAGTANDDPLTAKVRDMKNFAFSGWSGGSGPSVGVGGRAAFLDTIADGPDSGQLPSTPVITYVGVAGYPTDGLQFQTSAFSDPQGSGTFAAVEWRIGEIEDPTAPAWEAVSDFILENDPIWESGELAVIDETMSVPGKALRVGRTYRARVRHKDDTGRFSHWSAPVEFTTAEPIALPQLQDNLVISEIMYHPGPPSVAESNAGFEESDFEYLELQNISETTTLDLTEVRFTKGADFDFRAGAITNLAPGEFVLVVKNIAAFELRYGFGLPVAGQWNSGRNLSNGGERLKLSHGAGTTIRDFDYDDDPPWPGEADGNGNALVLVDSSSAPDHGLATSWRVSSNQSGSPGGDDGVSLFAEWMALNGFTDPLAEWKSSGFSNLLAFAFGVDLTANIGGSLPVVSMIEIEGEQYPVIEYRRRNGASDLKYAAQVGFGLLDWSGATVTYDVVAMDDGTERVLVRSATPISVAPKQFLRVVVSVN